MPEINPELDAQIADWKAAGETPELIALRVLAANLDEFNELKSLRQTAVSLQQSIDSIVASKDSRRNKTLREERVRQNEVNKEIARLTSKPAIK